MRQRVMLAIALAGRAGAADRRRTHLRPRRDRAGPDPRAARSAAGQPRGMAVLLITHDLGIVAGRADRVRSCTPVGLSKSGPTATVFTPPRASLHPRPARLAPPASGPAAAAAGRSPAASRPDAVAGGLPLPSPLPARRVGAATSRHRSPRRGRPALSAAGSPAGVGPRHERRRLLEVRDSPVTTGRAGSSVAARRCGRWTGCRSTSPAGRRSRSSARVGLGQDHPGARPAPAGATATRAA